jgi:hypothetical protein
LELLVEWVTVHPGRGAIVPIRAIGNSAGATIPKTMLERYRMAEGDRVHLVETEHGILFHLNQIQKHGAGENGERVPSGEASPRCVEASPRQPALLCPDAVRIMEIDQGGKFPPRHLLRLPSHAVTRAGERQRHAVDSLLAVHRSSTRARPRALRSPKARVASGRRIRPDPGRELSAYLLALELKGVIRRGCDPQRLPRIGGASTGRENALQTVAGHLAIPRCATVRAPRDTGMHITHRAPPA